MQWIRRAKTCLRSDGAAAGVTLAVMKRHLSSGAAVPVNMPEYQELARVASQWEAWEVGTISIVMRIGGVIGEGEWGRASGEERGARGWGGGVGKVVSS